MQQIVQTIQAAQYDLIQKPLDRVLVVQGGPGTGKTIVALHRVSWLLYNHREDLTPADVLVLGPSRPFIRYIRGVLPSLGDQDVTQTEVTSLGPDVRRGREESRRSAAQGRPADGRTVASSRSGACPGS